MWLPQVHIFSIFLKKHEYTIFYMNIIYFYRFDWLVQQSPRLNFFWQVLCLYLDACSKAI